MYDLYIQRYRSLILSENKMVEFEGCQKSARRLEMKISYKFGHLLEFHRMPSWPNQSVIIMHKNTNIKNALYHAYALFQAVSV